jgi:hypothetical protein
MWPIFARNTLDLGSASPVGYALRTPTHSPMFGALEQRERRQHGIALPSNGQISYPILSAGASTAALAVRETRSAGAAKPRLLDRVREAIRVRL